MAKDRRILRNGQRMDYTCENKGYETDTYAGYSHSTFSTNGGSFFSQPLISSGVYSIWLEHVIEKSSQKKCYWIMWYDASGQPAIPISAVFYEDELQTMRALLAENVTLGLICKRPAST